MSIPGIGEWIKNLSNPLVLIGFALMLFALVMVKLKSTKNSAVRQSFTLLFILVLGAEIAGIVYLFKTERKVATTPSATQESKGIQSPNIEGSGNVNINYGRHDTLTANPAPDRTAADSTKRKTNPVPKATVNQNSSGAQSPNISGSDHVNIQYR